MEECTAGHPAGRHNPGHTMLKPSVGASVLAACNPGPCTRRSTAERLCLSCNEFAAVCALAGAALAPWTLHGRHGQYWRQFHHGWHEQHVGAEFQSSREPPEQPKPTTRATRARALELVEAGSPVPTPPRVRYREGVGSVEDTGVWVLEF